MLLLSESEARLLDMDGTLADTEPLWFAAERAVATHFGTVLPEVAWLSFADSIRHPGASPRCARQAVCS